MQQTSTRDKAVQGACQTLLFNASLLVKNPYICSKFFKHISDLQKAQIELDIIQFECSSAYAKDMVGFYSLTSQLGKVSNDSDSPKFPFESKYTLQNDKRMTCAEYMVN